MRQGLESLPGAINEREKVKPSARRLIAVALLFHWLVYLDASHIVLCVLLMHSKNPDIFESQVYLLLYNIKRRSTHLLDECDVSVWWEETERKALHYEQWSLGEIRREGGIRYLSSWTRHVCMYRALSHHFSGLSMANCHCHRILLVHCSTKTSRVKTGIRRSLKARPWYAL